MDIDSEAQAARRKIDGCNWGTLKCFALQRKKKNRVKKQLGEGICKSHKGLIPKVYKKNWAS
jgi:hypothetical protein